jgi:hypothetical protein
MQSSTDPLPSGTDPSLYDILGVPPTASQDEIKKAYRRLALQHHPDKAGPNSSPEQFQQIQHAWSILGNDKLRPIYDRYGQMGVDMMGQWGEQTGWILDPRMESFAVALMLICSVVLMILLLFPILVALKADGVMNTSWAVAFLPLWLMDAILYAFVVMRYFVADLPDTTSASANDLDEDVEDGADAETAKQERRRQVRLIDRAMGVKRLVETSLFVLFQIFLVLKLDGTLPSWSWFSVFAPWLVIEAFSFLAQVVSMFALSVQTSSNDLWSWPFTHHLNPGRLSSALTPFHVKIAIVLLGLRHWIYRMLVILLICLRADNVITADWGLVFLPVYVQFIDLVIAPIVNYTRVPQALPAEQKQGLQMLSSIRLIFTLITGALFFISFGMFIARINHVDPSQSYSVAVILIPVFIVLGLTLCCCCCCMPCIVISATMGEEPVRRDRPFTDPNNPLRQIEYFVRQEPMSNLSPPLSPPGSGSIPGTIQRSPRTSTGS